MSVINPELAADRGFYAESQANNVGPPGLLVERGNVSWRSTYRFENVAVRPKHIAAIVERYGPH